MTPETTISEPTVSSQVRTTSSREMLLDQTVERIRTRLMHPETVLGTALIVSRTSTESPVRKKNPSPPVLEGNWVAVARNPSILLVSAQGKRKQFPQAETCLKNMDAVITAAKNHQPHCQTAVEQCVLTSYKSMWGSRCNAPRKHWGIGFLSMGWKARHFLGMCV